jgi:hypothetical protein
VSALPAMTDRDLEDQIDSACQECEATEDPRAQREAWERLRELIAQRSPARVRAMEMQRGLR